MFGHSEQLIYDTLKTDVRDNVIENVIDNVIDNTPVTIGSLAKKMSVSVRTICRDLDKMKSLGIVKREGGDYGGRWVIITNK